jgi:hypothetical protein
MKINELTVTVKPAPIPIKGYRAVQIRIRMDALEKEANELLKEDDFKDRFHQMMTMLETETREAVEEYEYELNGGI